MFVRSTAAACLALALLSAPSAFAGARVRCCSWDNGIGASPVTTTTPAILSHEGGGASFGAKAADDFYLDPSHVHNINAFNVDVISSSFPGLAKARLEVYEDCDGKPGKRLFTWINPSVSSFGPSGLDSFTRYQYTFTPGAQATLTQPAKPLVLRGGVYWLSVVGLTDNLCSAMNNCDQTFWLASSDPSIKGRPAYKNIAVATTTPGGFTYLDSAWQSSELCCNGCIDLAFSICADSCKIIHDAGGPDLTRASASISGGPSQSEARTADDIVIPPCDDQQLCYVAGYLATNCNPPSARLDIYDTDCRFPSTFSPPLTVPATKLTDTLQTVTIDGRVLKVYKVEVIDPVGPGGPITLRGGRNFWLSIYAVATGSVNERGYVLGAKRCDIPSCGGVFRQFQPAAVSGRAFGIFDFSWQTVAPIGGSVYDLGLTVAVRPAQTMNINASARCPADFDLSGTANIDDIFAFINAWFAGCP